MKWFRRKPPAPPDPIAFHPWTPPPLGSRGVEWDSRMEFPRDLAADRSAEESRKTRDAELRRRQASEIRPGGLAIRKAWHSWTIAAWCLLVCAATSTGPAAFLRLPLSLLVVPSALTSLYLIRNRQVFHRGIGMSVLALVLAGVLIAYEALTAAE